MSDAGKVIFFVYAAPIAYNHGVALLSAMLKERGVAVKLFVGDGNLDEWRRVLMATTPTDFICFSHVIKKDFDLSTPYIDAAVMSHRRVVLGGVYHRRNNPNQYDGVVPICRGDGESLVDLVLTQDLSVCSQRMVTEDLNSLPLPDYNLFKDHPYDGDIQGFPYMKKIAYNTSRGCIGRCSFCEVRHQHATPRVRTRVAEDIKQIRTRQDFELLFISDELCPYYSDEWLSSWQDIATPFFAFIRADISPERLEWLIKHGMKGCAFGVESGDEKLRNDVMLKDVTDTEIYRTASVLDNLGVYYAHFYMTNYPGETFKQKLATRKMSASLKGVPMIFDYTPVLYNTKGGVTWEQQP